MANRITGVARDLDNNPQVGASVELRTDNGLNELVASTTTDSSGRYTFTEDQVGYPGLTKIIITDTEGTTRTVSGFVMGQAGDIFIGDLNRAFRMMLDGVIAGLGSELAVSASGGNMDLSIGGGGAFLLGHTYFQDSPITVTVDPNGNANPRIDIVVLRLIPSGLAGSGTITPEIIKGTPAASPFPPGVTQDEGDVWEIKLANVRVDPGVSAITSGKVTDTRDFTSGPLMDASVTTSKLSDLAVLTAKIADEAVTVDKMSAGGQLSTTVDVKVYKAPVSGNKPTIGTLATTELVDFAETAATAGQVPVWNASTSKYTPGTLASGGDVSSNTATATDGEIVLFNGTSGKSVKRSNTLTGLLKAAAGVLGIATAADLPSAIDAAKIADGSVSNTEFQTLNGATSALQTQINGKAATSHTHTVSNITDLTATATELNYTDGVTSAIQTQLNAKAASSHTHTLAAVTDVTASAAEVNRTAGVTSNIQTQLDSKIGASHSHTLFQPFDMSASRNSVGSGGLAITNATSQDVLTDTQVLSSGVTYDIWGTAVAMLSAGTGGTIEAALTLSGSVDGALGTTTWLGTPTENGERSVMLYNVARNVSGGQTITAKLVARRGTVNGTMGTASFLIWCAPRNMGSAS